MKNKVIFPFVLVVLSMNYFLMSCTKNTDCKAMVKVVYADGSPVDGAAVKLYATVKTGAIATVTADIKANGTTDGAGTVSFLFKLPAIYDIQASIVSTSTGTAPVTATMVGVGIIKLEEGKTVEKTVTVK